MDFIEKGRNKTLILITLFATFIITLRINDFFTLKVDFPIIEDIRTMIAFYALHCLYKGNKFVYYAMLVNIAIILGLIIWSIMYIIFDTLGISESNLTTGIQLTVAIVSTIIILYKSKTIQQIEAFVEYQRSKE